mgnify:FL=1
MKLDLGKIFFLILFLTLSVMAATAGTVKGTITDRQTKEPLTGATVQVSGTAQGAVADLDGNYTLSNVSKGAILEFSYVGYVKLTKTVGNETTINAILYEDSQMLEGVEVVAFGTQKKESVIGAISTVKVAELKTPSSLSLIHI